MNTTDQVDNFIMAAGGVVENDSPAGIKIAVIFRSRYQGEWSLPKGKVEKGEDCLDTAIREVKEETGCECKITGFVGTTNYRYDSVNKLVLFWRMRPLGDCVFRPSEEVEKLEWLSPSEALARLNHEEERKLVAAAYGAQCACGRTAQRARPRSWFNRLIYGQRWVRIVSEIERYQLEIKCRMQPRAGAPPSQREAACHCAAIQSLQAADSALAAGNMDAAWKHLHAAQRMEILCLDEKDQRLRDETIVLREEAEKLNPWRKRAIEKLLGVKDSDPPPGPISLYQAAYIRDEHYSNQAHKDAVLRDHARRLVLALIAVMLVLFFLIQRKLLPISFEPSMFVGVAVFGVFGGTVSAFISFPRSTAPSRIPELVTTNMVTLLRLFMGAASAVIIYVFLNSNIPDLFTVKFSNLSNYTILAISFVAGFSERLVLHAVEKVAGK